MLITVIYRIIWRYYKHWWQCVEKNDLVALYRIDRAVDNHVEIAKKDRDGIITGYRSGLSLKEFFE